MVPPMGATLRRATAADIPAVADLFRASREDALPYLPVLHTAEEVRRFFGALVEQGTVMVAVDIDDQPTAFSGTAPGWLEHLYVHPRHQGRGVGGALLAVAQSAHPAGLSLWAFQRNTRARRFYERRGFRAVRFTDGASNEERTPDVLYHWSGSERPAPG